MTVLIQIASFFVTLGILVTFHEFGHYWVARFFDVKILRFSIGFGKTLKMWTLGADKTEWVLAAIPLGGYVKMADERDGSSDPAAPDAARAFNRKPIWQRMLIIVAGPVANFVLAAFVYWVLFVAGIPGFKPFVAEPIPNSEAARGGFMAQDLITKIGEAPIQSWTDARMMLLEHAINKEKVEIAVQDFTGRTQNRTLDFAGVAKQDLDQDFLEKLGLQRYRLPIPVKIDTPAKDSAAAKAGLVKGDEIKSVEGMAFSDFNKLAVFIRSKPEQALTFQVLSMGDSALKTVVIKPALVAENGQKLGRLGITPLEHPGNTASLKTEYETLLMTEKLNIFAAFPAAWAKVWESSVFNLKMFGKMLTGQLSLKNISGPLTIADYAGQSAQLGILPFITFLATVSIGLGVLNLLPVPVLDGGQLLYHMAEFLKGSPLSERSMLVGQQIGIALILGLTVFAFYNDIVRLISG